MSGIRYSCVSFAGRHDCFHTDVGDRRIHCAVVKGGKQAFAGQRGWLQAALHVCPLKPVAKACALSLTSQQAKKLGLPGQHNSHSCGMGAPKIDLHGRLHEFVINNSSRSRHLNLD